MTPAARSWDGCLRCRKRRQKCGEQKPTCARCQKDGVDCMYQKQLRFGGRPFTQSRFGPCLAERKGGARKVVIADGGFVYASSPSPQASPSWLPASTQDTWPETDTSSDDPAFEANNSLELIPRPNREEFHLPYQIEILPGIPPDNRALLQYFTCNASKALASHSFVHQEVCEVILPMAMGNLPLLYATLALAEIHRSALNSSIETGIDHDARRLVHHLTATSMRHLRKELEEPHLSPLGAKLATARTLFLCEAIAGSPTVRAWRAHFSGARALFSSRRQSPNGRAGSGEDSSLPFLQRWYTITEALVALTSEGLSGDQVASYGPRALLGAADSGDVCIDVYTGCAEDLAAAFREIGSVAWERRRTLDDPTSHPKLSVPYFVREAELLEISVRRMIERDKCRTTVFSMPGAHGLSGHEAREVLLCNEAYQHTALIHIHRRIRLLRSDAPQVQESVQRIIECVDSIKPAAALSPLTLLTTPLFTAGCEAKSAERRRIAHLLTNMFTHMRLPNMKRALHVLQAFWQESEVSGVDWEDFSRLHNWDFLPY